MKRVERSALLPYTAEQMFDVVNDVVRYPEFLPWCSETRLIEEDAESMQASLTMSRGSLRQSFTTRNTLDRPHAIDIELVDGPFTTLKGGWRFTSLGEDGCKVELKLRFDFNSRLANLALGKVFEQAADTMVDAFCDRARQCYG